MDPDDLDNDDLKKDNLESPRDVGDSSVSADLVRVGKVRGPRGLQGELNVVFFSDPTDWIRKNMEIFLASSNLKVSDSKLSTLKTSDIKSSDSRSPESKSSNSNPSDSKPKVFQLRSLKQNSGGHVLALKELTDRTQAEALVGSYVYADKKHFFSKPGERLFLSELLGFQVYDGPENVGAVEALASNGPQDLLVIFRGDKKDKEVQIPFVEAFLTSIDFENKKILMNLPFGLWQDSE